MMLHAFRNKFIRLAKDEDGVALVVTLAVFFFIYLVCMGVYAVGTNVRERIHLQNACDAAAYSAAAVQADTLSRIATINRAMSWTYVQLTRRQMDYIVYRWLRETVSQYKRDMANARSAGGQGLHFHNYWDIAPDTTPLVLRNNALHLFPQFGDKVRLNDSKNVEIVSVEEANDTFIATKPYGDSFYASGLSGDGLSRLRSQIRADKEAIREMNDAERDLEQGMGGRIEYAAREILKANIGFDVSRTIYFTKVPSPCLETPNASLDEEARFLLWSDPAKNPLGAAERFRTGYRTWFTLNDGQGFQREYKQTVLALKSAWHWHAVSWTCPEEAPCFWTPTLSGANAVRGIDVYEEEYFVGERANPRILKPEYFDAQGTVSVGLAKRAENPFARIFDVGGIFSAFNPFGSWTVALSSAKAGYAHNIPDDSGRNYWVSYKRHWRETDQPLNMSQSNWDAVHVPVRMAKVMADGRDWPTAGTGKKKPQWHAERISGHVAQWMSGEWKNLSTGAVSDESPQYAYAGGTDEQAADYAQMQAESSRQWFAWGNTPTHLTNESDNPVRVEWQIGNPGKNVNWDSLTERIFH